MRDPKDLRALVRQTDPATGPLTHISIYACQRAVPHTGLPAFVPACAYLTGVGGLLGDGDRLLGVHWGGGHEFLDASTDENRPALCPACSMLYDVALTLSGG